MRGARFASCVVVALFAAGVVRAEAGYGAHAGAMGAVAPSRSEGWIELWEEALALEAKGPVLEAAKRFERVASTGGPSEACWRAARSYWRVGDGLSQGAEEKRAAYFELADTWAGRGLERNPKCGECALWKYAALGRLTEIRGMVWGARKAREMKSLLDRGIALRPQHRDANGNIALANLYYASAVFHRMVPEWFWLPLVVGVRGDTDRALEDIRKALAFSSQRIDYQVEHGAVLLCQGVRRDRAERTAEGLEVLRASLTLPTSLPTDAVDQSYARLLLADPSKACAFSRRGFIDVEGEGRRVAVGARQ